MQWAALGSPCDGLSESREMKATLLSFTSTRLLRILPDKHQMDTTSSSSRTNISTPRNNLMGTEVLKIIHSSPIPSSAENPQLDRVREMSKQVSPLVRKKKPCYLLFYLCCWFHAFPFTLPESFLLYFYCDSGFDVTNRAVTDLLLGQWSRLFSSLDSPLPG